jgi:hypothetical protein
MGGLLSRNAEYERGTKQPGGCPPIREASVQQLLPPFYQSTRHPPAERRELPVFPPPPLGWYSRCLAARIPADTKYPRGWWASRANPTDTFDRGP